MKNKLPLAKDRGAQELMPDKTALLMCSAIATTPDSADYFYEKFVSKLKKAGLYESSGAVVALIQELRDNVHAQRGDRENPYVPGNQSDDKSEKRVLSDFENFQRNLCKIGINILIKNITGDIKINFAVSDVSEMVRSFLENNKEFGPKEIAAMDKVLNYLLSTQNMVSKNGVIYKSIDGKILEVDGKPVIADKAEVAMVLKKMLPEFLNKNNLQATSQQLEFPQQAPAVQVKPIPEPVKPAAPAPAAEAPVAPSTGIGR